MSTVITNVKTATVLSKYAKAFDNTISILVNSKKGLKPQAIFDFISLTEFPAAHIEKILNKTVKTFNNYKRNNTSLDPVVSEKLLKLFYLYDKGVTTFGTLGEFNKWMGEPAFGLGNQVPQNLLDTITGIELVAEELTRIQYGDLA